MRSRQQGSGDRNRRGHSAKQTAGDAAGTACEAARKAAETATATATAAKQTASDAVRDAGAVADAASQAGRAAAGATLDFARKHNSGYELERGDRALVEFAESAKPTGEAA